MSGIEHRDQKLVLIVEDNELSAKLFVDMLQAVRPHLRVECFECPEAGFEFAKEQHPDLIHLDCQLPYFSGFDFMTWCRAVPTLAHVPTVMITAQLKFNLERPAPDYPKDPRYFGLPRGALEETNSQLCPINALGVASCPRPDRVYYKPIAPAEYIEIIDEMIGPEDPLQSARRPLLGRGSGVPAVFCTPPRTRQFQWRRGRFLANPDRNRVMGPVIQVAFRSGFGAMYGPAVRCKGVSAIWR